MSAANPEDVRSYWNEHIHDLEMATQPVGSPAFFTELDEYRFEKLSYLPRLVEFDGYPGRRLLEVGCGIGTDLVRFARGGAQATAIDLASNSIRLARKNLQTNGVDAPLSIMDGESMGFEDSSFEIVYVHGVLQYTPNPTRMISEIYRVLRDGGLAIAMVYNRNSWLPVISRLTGVALEHGDAPHLRIMSREELEGLLGPFREVQITPERFPVPTRLHRGLKAALYNGLFVNIFNLLPRALTRPTGWHLMAFARK